MKNFLTKNWITIALCIAFMGVNAFVMFAATHTGNNINLDYTASSTMLKSLYWLVSLASIVCFVMSFTQRVDYFMRWFIAGVVLFIILLFVLPSLAPARMISF